MYTKATVMEPPRFLAVFNQPPPKISTGVRDATSTPIQSLTLLNDPFMIHQSEAFAARLEAAGDERITRAFVLAYGRPPREDERDALIVYARRHGMARACRVMFNANEFAYCLAPFYVPCPDGAPLLSGARDRFGGHQVARNGLREPRRLQPEGEPGQVDRVGV